MAFQFLNSLWNEPPLLVSDDENNDSGDESDIDVNYEEEDSEPDVIDNDNIDESGDEVRPSEWSENLTDVSVEECTEYTGSLVEFNETTCPLDIFDLYFPPTLYELIAQETNLYARQRRSNSSTDTSWRPCTSEDIQKYVYINIMMGIHSLPDLNLYWSSDLKYRVPAVADVMGRTRYFQINNYLHAADSTQMIPLGIDGYDPLFKVRPILDVVRSKCKELYKPTKEISIDEAMVKFNGRLTWKQYLPNKPAKYGIKVWCAAESKTGYLLNFSVYTGKQNNVQSGLGHHVVMNVGVDYLNQYRIFYFDNFFSSVQLAADLLDKKTYCCGTIRKNRVGWPFREEKTKKGEMKMRQKGNMVATTWYDKREVNLLSTNSNPTQVTVSRNGRAAGPTLVDIPAPVASYNQHMGGVDLADQYRSYYQIGRASKKWWRYIFWFLVQTAMINSYLLLKSSITNPRRRATVSHHLSFRMRVLDGLLKRAQSNTISRGICEFPAIASTSTPRELHKSLRLPGRKKRCFQCAAERKKTPANRTPETVFGCTICNLHLCAGPCHLKFHRLL